MALGSSGLSAYENAIPGDWRRTTHGISTARGELFLSIVDNGDAVRHEVENHGIAEVKKERAVTRARLVAKRDRTHYKL